MHSFIQRLAVAFSAIALATVLVSCGGSGGGSGDNTQAQGKGTVGILLTDKPADPALFAAIIASVIKVELMGSEENGPITLYSGPPKEFDLLRLRNESIPLVFKDNVPAGTYCKIRLILSDLELVLVDDTSEHPKLPGNGKLDLVARDCFSVVDGEVLTLQLDIDAGKSIHIIANKKGFNFRPVIFVDVVNQDFDSKLVRLSGKITAIDSDRQSLLLCHAVPNKDMDNLGCVNVHFGADAAFFDNVSYSGAPRSIDELLADDKLGMELTVVGTAKSWASVDNDDDKPAAYYPLLHLEALVAELGDFLQVEGTVAVDADVTGFAMTVSAGGPVITDSPLAVMYQPGGTNINGTRIVSKSGVLLNPLDVKELLPVQVDGTLQLMMSIDPMLKAALVIIDKGALGVEQVTGVIQMVGINSVVLVPDADTVCGVATSQLMVDLTSDVKILTVTITDFSSVIVHGGTLKTGQTVGMNGTCEVTGYQTDNVVIVDDQRD
jgi:hypothetical protein